MKIASINQSLEPARPVAAGRSAPVDAAVAFKRFYVVDALRAVLALCVVIGHVGVFPLFGTLGQADATADFLVRGLRTLVFGPPAVIAFFVISGFCIHYPFSRERRLPVARFYARRYVRILTPIVGVLVLAKLVLPDVVIVGRDSVIWHSTLWSVLCEEIYYAIYPLLFAAAPRVGWRNLLIVAFCLSFATILYTFPAVDWEDVGIFGTATILLPVWLLGCYLAETIGAWKRDYSLSQIWLWRFAAWWTMWVALALHFHSDVHQTTSGVFVGIFCFFWLRAEIGYYKDRKPWSGLVWAGRWSYSLYLVHAFVVSACLRYALVDFDSRLGWATGMALILAASYGFYLLIERPSHLFARRKFPFTRSVGAEVRAEANI